MRNSFLLATATILSGIPLAYAHAQSSHVPPPPQFVTDPNGIDPKSLLLNYTEVDLRVGTDLTAVELVRGIPTHRTTGRQELGRWINSFEGYIYTSYDNSDDPSKSIRIGNTTLTAVIGNRSIGFTKEYGADWELDDVATAISTVGSSPNFTATITDGEGVIYEFGNAPATCEINSDGYENACSYLTKLTYPNGLTWNLDYETWTRGSTVFGRVKRARSNSRFAFVFEYGSTTSDRPSKICVVDQSRQYVAGLSSCPADSLAVNYSYTMTGLGDDASASSVTRPDGGQVLYAHSWGASDPYFGMRRAGESTYEFYYKRFFAGGAEYRRGANLSGGGGDLWTYTGIYVDACGASCMRTQAKQMDVTAPNGSMERYEWRDYVVGTTHMIDPLPMKITNGLGNFQTIDYGLTGGFVRGRLQPKVVTLPESNRFEYTYDDRLNRTSQASIAKTGSGLSSTAVSAVYPASCSPSPSCNKPTSLTDANGGTTNLAYATHGGLLTEMGPAPTSGGVRPLKVTTWGQRYAYLKNASGSLVAAPTPMWAKLSETQCQTAPGTPSSPACDSAAPQVVTSYEYGATGSAEALLVKGIAVTADGQSLRTCYGYDAWGRKISETSANANLASCS